MRRSSPASLLMFCELPKFNVTVNALLIHAGLNQQRNKLVTHSCLKMRPSFNDFHPFIRLIVYYTGKKISIFMCEFDEKLHQRVHTIQINNFYSKKSQQKKPP